MNKLQQLLDTKKENLLNIYCTAGFPQLNSLPAIVDELHANGVDMVEIGIPYSDPLADGPTIQSSNSIALKNGITIDLIFEQLAKTNTVIPKIAMGYFNPVLQYGFERFCKRCSETGVDALILPDLPMEIYNAKYRAIYQQYGLSNIFLITPQTSDVRIRMVDDNSTAFIYAVTASGTTGKTGGLADASDYLLRLKQLNLKHPILAGFSISQPQDLAMVQQYVNGGIIGSAFIKHIAQANDITSATREFVSTITKRN